MRNKLAEYNATTEKVIAAFVSERQYQLSRWGHRQADGSFKESHHSIEDFILYMEDYLDEARKIISRGNEPECVPQTLDVLRKVAVLAVACFEINGIEPRDLTKPIVNGRDKMPASVTKLAQGSSLSQRMQAALALATEIASGKFNGMQPGYIASAISSHFE